MTDVLGDGVELLLFIRHTKGPHALVKIKDCKNGGVLSLFCCLALFFVELLKSC